MGNELPFDRRRRAIATMTIASIVIILIMVQYWKIQSDDAYIFFSYAKNIAQGNGYVFNPGEHINATTSPLYTVLIALVFFLFQSLPFITIPFVGHLIGAVSLLFLCYFLMKCFENETSSVVPSALPLVLLCSPLLAGGVGMETFLMLMTGVACLYLYIRERFILASLGCAIAVLARPDMLVLVGILFIHYLVRQRRLPSMKMVLIFVSPIAAWMMFSLAYFGDFLPTTISAKLAQTEGGLWGPGMIFFRGFTATFVWFSGHIPDDPSSRIFHHGFVYLFAFTILSGLAILVAKFRQWLLFRNPAFQIIVLWNILYLIAYGLVLKAPAYSWYYTPFALTLALLASLPFEGLHRVLATKIAGRQHAVLAGSFVPLIVIASFLPSFTSYEFLRSKYDVYKEAAQWLNTNAAPGSTVGAGDIGVLRFFYTQGNIICAGGLVTPPMIEHIRTRDNNWYAYHYRPDYLMLNYPPRREVYELVHEEWFQKEYVERIILERPRQSVSLYERVIAEKDTLSGDRHEQ